MKRILFLLIVIGGLNASVFSQYNQVADFTSAQEGSYESGVVNYASSIYMFKFKQKELKTSTENDQLQYIVLDGKKWYPYSRDNSAFFVKESGSQKLTFIDGKIYQWIGNMSEDKVELTMMYQKKGYPNKDPKKYLKTLKSYLSKANVPDTDKAKAKAGEILMETAKNKMENGDLAAAAEYISDARSLLGYSNQEAKVLGEKITSIIENGQAEQALKALKDSPNSIYGKDVEDIEIKIVKYDNSEYSSGYFGYYCEFKVIIEAKLSDGSIISTDNTETFLDPKKNKYVTYLNADYDLNVYGCRRLNSSTFMPYPWKDDMYSPYITVEVKSNYDSKLSKSVQIPISYTEPVIVDYRGQSSIKPGSYAASPEYIAGDGPDVTVEVWTGKNEYNDELILLYDVYETGGELLNTVYLKPNTDLLVYIKGSQSPRGDDGELTVVVKDDRALGYSVKSDVSNSSSAGRNNSTTQLDETDSKFTIINNTGSMIRLIDDRGNTQGSLNNGSSKTFYCDKVIYQANENNSGNWNVKGRLIADGDNVCGQKINYK